LYGGKEYQDQLLGSSMLGLYDFHARYYNPLYGRWFNIDPALQSTNPYIYCGNSPMMYVDPDGEFAWLLWGAALIGGYLGGSAANDNFNPFKWDWSSWSTWGGIMGGAIQGMTTVVGMQAGFAQMGWEKWAKVGRGATKDFLTNTIKVAETARWAKAGMTVKKSLLILNSAMQSLNTVSTLASVIADSQNAGQILKGNFYYNPRRTFLGQVWEGFSRGTRESIQQNLGSAIGHLRNTFDGVTNVELFNGATLINYRNNSDTRSWGMTLGNMINSQNLEASIDDAMFMHEYGHTQQSKLLGDLYPFMIGIPSLISAAGDEEKHSNRWYEKSANRYAERYFRRFHGVDWGIIQRDNHFTNGNTKYPTR
jgi:RHS repeat-associated protein